MLRFNLDTMRMQDLDRKFQYILCYGSTFCVFSVTALDRGFQYILCYGSTTRKTRKDAVLVKFQYILCYGSTIAVHMIYAFHYTGITLKHQQFL